MLIKENLQKLIKGTTEGKIKWEQSSPTTYIWSTKASDGRKISAIVQKTKINEDEFDLMFRLWNNEDESNLLEMSYTDCEPEGRTLLQKLYETITGRDLFISDIFSNILKDI